MSKNMTALLTGMDGFKQSTKPIIIIGATNRIGQLDERFYVPEDLIVSSKSLSHI